MILVWITMTPEGDQASCTGVVFDRRDPKRSFPSSPLPQPNKPPSREFVLPARERKDHAEGEIGRSGAGASSRCPFAATGSPLWW